MSEIHYLKGEEENINLLIVADDDWYANLDGIITRRIPPGFIPLTAYVWRDSKNMLVYGME